jgi:SAM-dependent methyltransferase
VAGCGRRAPRRYELEVLPGLEAFAAGEAREALGRRVRALWPVAPGRLRLDYDGTPGRLTALRAAAAVHAVAGFAGVRPSALLGHEAFGRLRGLVAATLPLAPGARTLRLSAAGADSPVLARLAGALAAALGLHPVRGPADVLVALRRPPGGGPGWEVLVRLGRRPQSARPWRVCDRAGALDASVAAAMVALAGATARHRFLNIACGSGTLLVERLLRAPAATAIGVDVDPGALVCARANLAAAGCAGRARLVRADAGRLPLAAATIDELVCDLPFGMVVGTPRDNERLYPRLPGEAARVAAPRARLVAVTASRRLFERLAGGAAEWRLLERAPLCLPTRTRDVYPCIYVLERTAVPVCCPAEEWGG